ncbi:MAG TPA: type II secretion system F family protein [Candidatus Babeliales bacterium]|nr:type II secretion system F family protein [Candidatus Babeliales bacterium]
MALYFYRALTRDGQRLSGQLDAASVQNAKELLVQRGVFPVTIESLEGPTAAGPWYRTLLQPAVTAKELILFTKQFAVLLRSGIPVLQALELMIDQFTGQLRTVLVYLKDGIKEGRSLADGLEKYPKIFSTIYVQLVRAGEATGNLELILERLTDFLAEQLKFRKKIQSALRYPIIQIVIVAVVVVALLAFVVPQMTQIFVQQGRELPLPTQLLLDLSNFMRSYFLLLLLALGAVGAGVYFWARTPDGAYQLDKLKLRVPILGFFTQMGAVVQFCRTLGMLVEGGVTLAQALDIVCKIVDNRVLAAALTEARDNIIKEGRIAQYLKKTQIFPPVAIYLIKTGEESGQLGQMLNTVAGNYEEELGEFADSLSARIEPIMLITMAVIVGFVVLSIALPLMDQIDMTGM